MHLPRPGDTRPDTDPDPDPGLRPKLDTYLAEKEAADPTARLSVSYRGPGGPYDHHGRERHYAASTMKLPVLLAAYRLRDAGSLDLDRRVVVADRFASALRGSYAVDRTEDSDPEVWARLGRRVSLRWLLQRMTVRSSNLATNLVLDQVGLDAVAAALAACADPLAADVVVARGIEDLPAREAGVSNVVSSAGLTAVLDAIHRGVAAAPPTCAEVLDVLAAGELDQDVVAGVPPGTRVARKGGWVTGVVHDAAVVTPGEPGAFVLTVCTSTRWPPARAHGLIADLAAICWRHRRDGQPWAEPHGSIAAPPTA